MNRNMTTANVIEDLLQSSSAAGMDARAQYLLRQSLYSLVRLAKAEQMLEIKSNAAKLTSIAPSLAEALQAEIDSQATYINVQQHFEFQDPNS